MKLRTRANSIRLRLTQKEVTQLAESGEVVETLTFAPGSTLSYALAAGDGDAVRATLTGTSLRVTAPRELVRKWAASDEVGFEATQPAGDVTLSILVEKDWACLKPRAGEDDADAYPNPNETC
jgi:hypothetical protein